MIRVKITKSVRHYTIGDTVYLTKNEAFGLLDSGYAEISKDITVEDMRVKGWKPIKRKPKK